MAVKLRDASTMGPESAATILINKKPINATVPKRRQELLKWNGWGYQDSQFHVDIDRKMFSFSGDRYPIGSHELPHFYDWISKKFDVDLSQVNKSKQLPHSHEIPPAKPCLEFQQLLSNASVSFSNDGVDRLVRCHGHALQDIVYLRELNFSAQPLPDLVVWPSNHDQVVAIVDAAKIHNVVLLPFGGGTSVSWAVTMPKNEDRVLVAVDTSQMNRLLWLDEDNLVACYEAGIVGQDMERNLRAQGYTSGHEPDSYEFSSLGGWVATRASGMKKNTYGNIEDIVVSVRMVTPSGVLHKRTQAPRISSGPDFDHVILGSEGTLGIVTEVAIKIRPVPQCRKYGSIVFHDFDAGFSFVRQVALRRCQPTSVRLIDNEQFKFGQALRPGTNFFGLILDGLKRAYVTKIKGFHPDKMCVATLLFEGETHEVAAQEQKVYELAKNCGGVPAGETNGRRGYTLTFVIAYIRDLALDFHIAAESFETSVPWDRALFLIRNVKHRLNEACDRRGITHRLISARITQTYDTGCCIYFYFGFKFLGLSDPLGTYHYLEDLAREEILAVGGSISHHHGVGKARAKWYPKQDTGLGAVMQNAWGSQHDSCRSCQDEEEEETMVHLLCQCPALSRITFSVLSQPYFDNLADLKSVSSMGVELYKWTKKHLDPGNIFANGNLLPEQTLTPKSQL